MHAHTHETMKIAFGVGSFCKLYTQRTPRFHHTRLALAHTHTNTRAGTKTATDSSAPHGQLEPPVKPQQCDYGLSVSGWLRVDGGESWNRFGFFGGKMAQPPFWGQKPWEWPDAITIYVAVRQTTQWRGGGRYQHRHQGERGREIKQQKSTFCVVL